MLLFFDVSSSPSSKCTLKQLRYVTAYQTDMSVLCKHMLTPCNKIVYVLCQTDMLTMCGQAVTACQTDILTVQGKVVTVHLTEG